MAYSSYMVGSPAWNEQNQAAAKAAASYKAPSNVSGTNPANLPSSSDSWQVAQDKANAANEDRYKQGLGLWQKISAAYAPGGSFGQGAIATLEQQKSKSEAAFAQNQVSSGLYDSTTMAGYGGRYEQDVGGAQRLNIQDEQTKGYTGALAGEANWIYQKNEQAPNAANMANLTRSAANVPQPISFGGGAGYKPQQPTGADTMLTGGSGTMPGGSGGMGDAYYGITNTNATPSAMNQSDWNTMNQQFNTQNPAPPAAQYTTPAQQQMLSYNEPTSYIPGGQNYSPQPASAMDASGYANTWNPNWGDPINPSDTYYEDMYNFGPMD